VSFVVVLCVRVDLLAVRLRGLWVPAGRYRRP